MIEVKDLHKYYDQGRRHENHVLRGVSLTLPDTGFVCILGPSGCGKTSLLNAIGGLDAFQGGTVATEYMTARAQSDPLFEAERNRNFGYIFQNYYLLTDHSVGYNVYLGLHSLQISHREKLRRVRQALKAVDMDGYIRRQVSDLSGGQQQRVAIARAIARRPRVILADEPTGNLDEANTRQICTLLRQLSQNSLVVMVTHEERIARFYADRIITMDAGAVRTDEGGWHRTDLTGDDGRTLYTGDYEADHWNSDGLQLRIFREPGVEGVKLDVVVLKDRVILKLHDGRTVTCTGTDEPPFLMDGERPSLKLEDVDRQSLCWDTDNGPVASAGGSLRLREMLTEARYLRRGKGLRRMGTTLFLWVLTVLLCISTGDYMMLQQVEPEDFIQTHSQVLEITVERGPTEDPNTVGVNNLAREFKEYLPMDGSITIVPTITRRPSICGSAFVQMAHVRVKLTDFSYVPLDFVNPEQLILGRMPQTPDEVLVDRWVLDAIREKEGIVQNGIRSNDYFLGKPLDMELAGRTPVIVGICDSAECAVYLSRELFVTLGVAGTNVATLSALQARYPGKYDNVTLTNEQCMVLPAVAGVTYRGKEGAHYTTSGGMRLQIAAVCEETDFPAAFVVADSVIDEMMCRMSYQNFQIFTQDKAQTTALLQRIAREEMDGRVKVTVQDRYTQRMNAYVQASRLRADARTVVTFTIMFLSMGMLLLLRRVEIRRRIGMLAVYRLLGIPNRKTAAIFALESALSVLTAVVPATMLSWIGIQLMAQRAQLLFPPAAAVAVCLVIGVYHLAVSLIPLFGLLRLPPAQLAAKYE